MDELNHLDAELVLIEEQVGESHVSEESRSLRQRVKARENGDILFRFGSKTYRIDCGILKALPLNLGNPVVAYFRIIERLDK
ncbi:hypothetical protein [[Leptolyngbya] sp. PCC 7376]|uniref:hypothetical protein n=1 Tax=[Leptolyngbya] sp. PCC 7376 TaxID=111781 RepID=UPI0005A04ED4|nr:hypothetical protein [[Leptolyngbya] sp. PCC 7376]